MENEEWRMEKREGLGFFGRWRYADCYRLELVPSSARLTPWSRPRLGPCGATPKLSISKY